MRCLLNWVVFNWLALDLPHQWTFLNSAGDGSSGKTPRWERLVCQSAHSWATTSNRNQAWAAHSKTSQLWVMLCQGSFTVISSNCELGTFRQRMSNTWHELKTVQDLGNSLHFKTKSSRWKLVYCTSQRAVSKSKLTYRYEEITSMPFFRWSSFFLLFLLFLRYF